MTLSPKYEVTLDAEKEITAFDLKTMLD